MTNDIPQNPDTPIDHSSSINHVSFINNSGDVHVAQYNDTLGLGEKPIDMTSDKDNSSLFLEEDFESLKHNYKTAQAPADNLDKTFTIGNEDYYATIATGSNNSHDDKHSKKLPEKIRFIKKQPAPSTLKNHLGKPINVSITPRRNLFNTNPVTPNINPTNDEDTEKFLQILRSNPIDNSLRENEVHDLDITKEKNNNLQKMITNPYTKHNMTPTINKTDTKASSNSDSIDNQKIYDLFSEEHFIDFEQDQDTNSTSSDIPQTTFPNTFTQTPVLKENKQKPIQSILQNKVQISTVSKMNLNLPPELETLRNVIMSQHNALASHIQELGNICLHHTNIIEKKKESSKKLLQEDRIPRSLRVKCELSTSPDFENNPDFVKLKQKLQEIVSNFTTQGLEVMQEWSLINIKLLIKDRCNNILKKALAILDGLLSYWTDLFEPTQWSTNLKRQQLLLLTKIFFTTDYFAEIDNITTFLEVSKDDIMLMISKILNQQQTEDTYHRNIIDSVNLNSLENANEKRLNIISECLYSFEQILYTTTTELWEANLQKIRESEASRKLQAQMEANKITSATELTAKAIDKAVANINTNNDINQNNQHRILILEKQAAHQKQLALEILNRLKSQKNSKGGQHGSLSSSQPRNPKHVNNKHPFIAEETEMIDLTHTQSQSPIKNQPFSSPFKKQKHIHWNDTHTITYHPKHAPIHTFAQSETLQGIQTPYPPNLTQGIHSLYPPNIPKSQHSNPFIAPLPQPKQGLQKYRGGRFNGGRRGSSRR
jgi:hypothetical protein